MLIVLALATAAPGSVDADLRCIAYLSGAINKAPAEQQAGMAAGILYYAGRIDVRRPGFDYRAALAPTRANTARLAGADKDARRCLSTVSDRGREIVAAGQAAHRDDPQSVKDQRDRGHASKEQPTRARRRHR